jgi:hypothetical protein
MCKRNFAALSLLLLLIRAPLLAQEIECQVSANYEQLPSANKDILANFTEDVKTYINGFRWSGKDFGQDRIKCTFNIFFTNVSSNNIYDAQVVIVSERPIYDGEKKTDKSTPILRLLDDKWQFTYVRNQPLYHDEYRFDPLASFLDYYAYLIVGYDLDVCGASCEKAKPLNGTPFFEKAMKVCTQGGSTSYSKGWTNQSGVFTRYSLVDELLNTKYEPLRKAMFEYHFNGLDLLSTDQNNQAMRTILASVSSILDLQNQLNTRSVLLRSFFDTKYLELAQVFTKYPDKAIYSRLVQADASHQKSYDEYRVK